MKNLFSLIFFLTSILSQLNAQSFEFDTPVMADDSFYIDIRDNQEYRILKIGDDWWFAENANYNVAGSKIVSTESGNKTRVYTYEQALAACPDGWHIPTDADWKNLEKNFGINLQEINNSRKVINVNPTIEKLNFCKYLGEYGEWELKRDYAIFWTSTNAMIPPDYLVTRIFQKASVGTQENKIVLNTFNISPKSRASLRFVKDRD